MISVVIPVYNQYEELQVLLSALSEQDLDEKFEVVIVDDASSLKNKDIIKKFLCNQRFDLTYIEHPTNRGRAVTRNDGIDATHGDVIVFCDADRFPERCFLTQHKECLQLHSHAISVGCVRETYEPVRSIISNKKVPARKAFYYKVIENLFDENGETDSAIRWIATLSGNMAITRIQLGDERFDGSFSEWGFEHFELGYRLVKNNTDIVLCRSAKNTHIAHQRENLDYGENNRKSHD